MAKPKQPETWHVFAITELPLRHGAVYPVAATAEASLQAMFKALDIQRDTSAPIVAVLTPGGLLEVVGPSTHESPARIMGELVKSAIGDGVRLRVADGPGAQFRYV